MSKSKSKQEEVRQILDDLDSLSPESATQVAAPSSHPQGQDPSEVLAFLEEITQKSSEPTRLATAPQIERPLSRAGTPTIRKSSERVRLGGVTPLSKASSASLAESTSKATPQPAYSPLGWGWNSVWTSASAAIQQARTVVDEQVRNLPANEQARKVLEYAKAAQLEKLGLSLRLVMHGLALKHATRPRLQACWPVDVDRHSECRCASHIKA